ncbi:UDP-N-acetylmuramoyl-L-alanine--D-glutamate ligase [Wenzhouxiangella sp. AB-CW3]|uniref:UDP-N-acetylmuramoyl-L-alanine--D-glutamate ligase n=1 Tax=Wenzhouxiangella sp. AB-CW3 TaxID=2771012 RepID=UPI00168B0022|nr:UDP-N-acetylmuramoyl-L-alanine--D-glutamate ligase [Wenzhouxiangella sp. AB-CW3]QOC23594.1 UDP-N-acetylmuramoyl-L-alanine--D-glutamate ligase [Wenzhouxiangella sp. AB-CW3]
MTCSPTLEFICRHRVGVLGYGREGRGVVRALKRHDPDIDLTVLIEAGSVPEEVPARIGPFDAHLLDYELLLRSPGVPVDHPALVEFRRHGGRVINPSSIWLAERADVPVIGITGSKGKSTTASVLAHLFREAGVNSLLAGNIGIPLIEHLDTDAETVVLELSSYQLTDLEGRLAMGLMTRLFPEHLDWHGSLDDYVHSKLRLAALLAGRPLLVNANDPVLMAATEGIPGRIAANRPPCIHRLEDALWLDDQQLSGTASLSLMGRHNLDNVALALEAGRRSGLDLESMLSALKTFRPLSHRLEVVAESNGVRWINDSISTSPYATRAALEALGDVPVILIVGGKDRSADWSELIAWSRIHRLQALLTLPDNGAAIGRAFRDRIGPAELVIHAVENVEEAVQRARRLSRPGSVVLLSPGAPSFPQFRDFEERGERFAAAARGVSARQPQ